ncbi:MAG TPA: hypothetical protein VLH59_01640 [Ignavibacteriaceae bacterium]|nr:hypothetical protein [Ignavibacteriaceae bacterium]
MLFRSLKVVVSKSHKISFQVSKWFSAAIVALLFLYFLSCDDNGVEPRDIPLPPLPDDAAIFVSMDDADGLGMLILNANTLEPIDSMYTTPGFPFSIEFSPDYNTWYSSWGRNANYCLYSGSIHPIEILNSIPLIYAKGYLAQSPDRGYIVAYGYKGIDVFERETLNLLYQDTTITDTFAGITFSKKQNNIYYVWTEKGEIVGIGVFNIELKKTIDTLRLFNRIKYPDIASSDIVVSNDDKYLFFSAWNWRGLGGYGSFFVIDLIERRIIKEYPAGAFSQLGISPDGINVYMGDPGGYLYILPSLKKVWRYDIKNKTMNIFFDSFGGTDQFASADDNRTIFISAWGQFKTPDGIDASIVKVDALTKKIIGSYTIPKDSLGNYSRLIRNIKFGKYSIN